VERGRPWLKNVTRALQNDSSTCSDAVRCATARRSSRCTTRPLRISTGIALRILKVHLDPVPLDDESADHAVGPAEAAMTSDELTRLRRCLDRLSDEQRAIVLLVHHEGYTPVEIAQKQRVPLGTVKTWVRRGLISLRDARAHEAREPHAAADPYG
jgi:RNA polymerase sigma factor (sigma-70 family)